MNNSEKKVPLPHPTRCSPDWSDYAKIIEIHKDAFNNNRDWYLDPETGYKVFTAGFLLKRGVCCNSGCRHCPYLTKK